MKKFDLDDVFLMSEIIDKMGIDADVQDVLKQVKTAQLKNAGDAKKLGKEVIVGVGIGLITKMVRNLHKAKEEVKQLISQMTGRTKEEVSAMGISEFKQFFDDLVKDEEFADFLKQQ